ncbi:hypothetical protein NE358_04545 [Sphingomonas sp. G5]
MSMLLATAGSMPASPRGARSTGEGAATTATRTIFADALAHAAVSRDDAAGPVLPAEPVTAAADTLDASADGSDDRPAEPAPSSGSEATAFGAEAVTGMAIPASMAVRTDVVPAVGSSASHTAATEPIAAAVAGEPFAQTPPAAAGAPETRPLVGVPLAGIASDGARPAADGREDAALVALAAGNGAERSSDPTTCAAVTADTRANAALPTSARPGAAVASPRETATAVPPSTASVLEAPPGLEAPRAASASTAPPVRALPPAAAAGPAVMPEAAPPGGVVVTGLALAAAPEDAPARHEAAPSVAATAGPSGVAATPPLSTSAPLAPAPAETAAPTSAQRSIAAQVAPAIVHIAQRPAGTHRITLTITPEATGPVTVRAHIGPGGEVRIDLAGATEAGRDALRAMVADLRRDLAAVNPHAHLSVGSPLSADAGTGDRGAPSENGSDPSDRGRGSRPDDTAPSASTRPAARLLPALSHVVPGGGLDILV